MCVVMSDFPLGQCGLKPGACSGPFLIGHAHRYDRTRVAVCEVACSLTRQHREED